MAVDGFDEIFNIVYIAKKLYDMGKYGLVTESFSDAVEYDNYYEGMYELIANIFEFHDCNYYENHGLEIHILSDKVIVDFFTLAGEYGRRNNVTEEENPYIKAAHEEIYENLNISHELDWKLMGHTEPKRPFHSRLGLFISHECGCLDLGVLAYRLIEIHEWFEDKCEELHNILDDTMGGRQLTLWEAMAA